MVVDLGDGLSHEGGLSVAATPVGVAHGHFSMRIILMQVCPASYGPVRLAGKICSMLTSLIAVLAVVQGVDGSADASRENDVEDITITGTRTPTLKSEIPGGVSVLTAADLEIRQIVRVIDALKALPGVSVARAGTGGLTQLRLRGAEANHVLVLIDGVEANDPSAADDYQYEHLSVTEIERIELIRGGQSAMWGSDALAGVINIVTRKGSEGFSGAVRSEAGSFGTVSAGGRLSTGGDGWHMAFGADWRDSDGVNISRQGEETDPYDNLTLNFRGGADLGDRVTVDASLRYEDTSAAFDGTDFTTSLPADSDDVNETSKLFTGVTVSGVVVPETLKQTVRITYLDTEVAAFQNGSANGDTTSETLSLYADTVYTPIEDHSVTLFVDYEDIDFRQRGDASPFGDPNRDEDYNVVGFGAQYRGELVGGLVFTGAIRHDDFSDFGDFTSWSAGLSAAIPPTGTRIFGNVSRGFKAPTFTERFGFFTNFQGNPDLQPEESFQVEFGLEQAFSDTLRIGVTAYFADLDNEINGFVFDPVTFNFTAGNNSGTTERNGFEITLDAEPLPGLTLSAQYSYLDADEPDGLGGRLREIRRPRHEAALSLQYVPDETLSLALDIDYTGQSTDFFFDPNTFAREVVALDDYFLVRLAGSYAVSDRVAITARVENLLDADYEDILGFNTPGAAAYGGLRVTF